MKLPAEPGAAPRLSMAEEAAVASGEELEAREPLLINPRAFDFYVAVARAHRLSRRAEAVGGLSPTLEPVIFNHDPRLTFQPTDVAAAKLLEMPDGSRKFQITTAFFGLVGPRAPLAEQYAEETQLSEGGEALEQFYNWIHHRLLSLLYRSRLKYRPSAVDGVAHLKAHSERALALAGYVAPAPLEESGAGSAVGSGAERRRPALPERVRIGLAPLLALPTRSRRALRLALALLLPTVPVTVQARVERVARLADDQRCQLGVAGCHLGQSTVLGDRLVDSGGGIAVRIGPVPPEQHDDVLPGGETHGALLAVLDHFCASRLDFRLDLALAGRPAAYVLGERGHSCLGVNIWLPREGSETVLSFSGRAQPPEASGNSRGA